jgi:hypothetical protein
LKVELALIATFSAPILSSVFFYLTKDFSELILKSQNILEGLAYKKLIIHFSSTLFLIFILNFDKIFFSHFLVKRDFAIYTIAGSLFSPIVELLSSAGSVILNETKKRVSFLLIMKLLFINLFSITIFHFSIILLVPVIFGEKYVESMPVAESLTVFYFLVVVYKINDVFLRIEKEFKSMFINALLFCSFIFIVIYYFFEPLNSEDFIQFLTVDFLFAVLLQFVVITRVRRET